MIDAWSNRWFWIVKNRSVGALTRTVRQKRESGVETDAKTKTAVLGQRPVNHIRRGGGV